MSKGKKQKNELRGNEMGAPIVDDAVVVSPDSLMPESESMIAKKNFEIHQNDYHRIIKVGDDLSDVPKIYYQNLKTEGVL